MTHSTENRDRPVADRAPGDLDARALRAWSLAARARAAELHLQLDTRRRRYRELAVRAEQRAAAPSAAEIAELRSRAEQAEGRAGNLERALATNRRIGMAIGILLARLHCTEEEAFDVLRRESMRRNVEVAQLAEQVVHTGTR